MKVVHLAFGILLWALIPAYAGDSTSPATPLPWEGGVRFLTPSLWLARSAQDPGLLASHYAQADFTLTADPEAAAWKPITGAVTERGRHGELIPGHRTEIRSRWTDKNLYFLFICPYQELHLKPGPVTDVETNQLWNWDVAEVFIGTDFENIKQYKEFQVSPQGEWVDLAIDRRAQPPNHNWQWNSGFAVKARIDRTRKVWYGEMRIPFAALDRRAPQTGLELRINFYRIQGPPPDRKLIAWQPTHTDSYHVPEAFGRLRLQK